MGKKQTTKPESPDPLCLGERGLGMRLILWSSSCRAHWSHVSWPEDGWFQILQQAEWCLNPSNRKAENTHFVWDQLVLECNGSVPNYIPESIKFVYCSLVEGLLRVQFFLVMIGCYGPCGSPYDSFSHTHVALVTHNHQFPFSQRSLLEGLHPRG